MLAYQGSACGSFWRIPVTIRVALRVTQGLQVGHRPQWPACRQRLANTTSRCDSPGEEGDLGRFNGDALSQPSSRALSTQWGSASAFLGNRRLQV